ncbi:OmpA family protein [Burkholderia sp. Ax-1719]|uniref:OmpA family protein n=1 Tax=Burkholderia sp. Ax-1719 TaxID=2608334 RepID=UPI0023DA7111|nr:OmpA family protein [Burkholderia sp. Ax-1719]
MGAIAIGAGSNTPGYGANATGANSIAIGVNTNATGPGATAIGVDSRATGSQALSFSGGTASGQYAIAIGGAAQASTDNSIALGGHAVANTNATSLATAGFNAGSGSLTAATAAGGEISVGASGAERRLTNLAAGLNGSDAVNVSQLQSENAKVDQQGATTASALGGGAAYNSTTGAISAPSYALTNANAIDGTSGAKTDIGTALSTVDAALGVINTNAVMYDSSAHASVTLGGTGAAVALHNVANGKINATSNDGVNGSQLYSLASSTANSMGGGSTVNANGSISNPTYVIGGKTFNNAGGAFTQLNGEMADAVMYDTSAHTSVSLGGSGTSVGIALHNVANGQVTATSLDGVNGSQLYSLASSTANSMGGGATVNANGSISNPTYVIGGKTFNNAGGAFTQLNGEMADAVMYDTSAHTSVSLGGSGTSVGIALHNVANGQVTATSLDGVNGSQLYSLASSTANSMGGGSTVNPNGSISNPTYVIGGKTYNNAGGAFTQLNGEMADAVMYDSSAHTSVSLGGSGTSVGIALHNVANGQVNATSLDGVNGSQLYSLASSTANSMGGGSTVNPNGSISNPTYVIGGKTYNNAGGAFTQLNGEMADAVTYDSSAHTSVSLGGSGTSVGIALHNVANGQVNLGQMNAAIANVTNIANNATDPLFNANGAFAGVGSDARALMPAAQKVADPYQRGLAEGWLEIADRQDSHVLMSKVYNDAAARALNNGRHFIDNSVPFQPIYGQKNWPSAETREKWVKALQEIERTNQRASQSPCRGEDAGRLAALTDEAWKEQDETHGTHWVHGWDSIERAQKLAQQVNGELDKCVPPAAVAAPVAVQAPAQRIALSADALFDFDSAVMKPEGHRQVELLAKQWRDSGAQIDRLTIKGFTDRFGSAAHNLKLSQQRALAVAMALKDQGVHARNVDIKGMGAATPVQTCAGKKATASVIACLAPNRRVEILTELVKQ